MKSRKSLKDIKFDFLKYFKPSLIAMLIVVLIAGVFWGVFGFNKGLDFTGGTQLVVEFPYDAQIQTDKGLNEKANELKDILADYDVKINSFQVQGEGYEKRFVVTFKDKDESKIEDIRFDVNKQFNTSDHYNQLVEKGEEFKILTDDEYSLFDITKQTTSLESLINVNAVISTISTLLFALIIAMIYALIRFKTVGGLTIVFAGIVNIVLTTAFVLLARIEINTYFFALLGLVLFISVYSTASFLFKIKECLKNPALTDKTNYDLASIVVKHNLLKTILVNSCALIVTLIVGLFAVLNVLHLSLIAFVGIAVTGATHLFVVPAFWATINKKRELLKPAFSVNEDDKSAEEIVIEENINDSSAEEVVIEENKEN